MTSLDQLAHRRSQATPKLIASLRRDGLFGQPIAAVHGPRVRIQGRWVLNFTSTNYLGLSHHPLVVRAAVRAAHAWGMSLATPRVLGVDRLTDRLEAAIAQLVGREAALVFPSTTHAALDVLPLLAGPHGTLFVDEWAYPLSVEGAYAATRTGAQLRRFPHDDARCLEHLLKTQARGMDKVIVCDGVYPAGGQPAALHAFERIASAADALLYVDDAHGIGILGAYPHEAMPYGSGGGGTPRYLDLDPDRLAHIGSLSKAFGVPVAFVAGPAHFIAHMRQVSSTATHSSPPALPVLAAALAALHLNATHGDALRGRLVDLVGRFRAGLGKVGLMPSSNTLFPIQTLLFTTPHATRCVARELRRAGIWAVPQFGPPERPAGGALRFVLNVCHQDADVDMAVDAIAETLIGAQELSRVHNSFFPTLTPSGTSFRFRAQPAVRPAIGDLRAKERI